MSDDQQINPGLTVGGEPLPQPLQTSIVLGQPVSDPHDGFVLGEPVLDDAQPPIANGQPAIAPPLDLPAANQDPNVQGDGPAAVNGHHHPPPPEPLIVQPPVPVVGALEESGDRSIAPPSPPSNPVGETAQETVVQPADYTEEETQESQLSREREMEQKSRFDSSDTSAAPPNRGFGVGKPLIVAGMVIAVLGVVVAGIRKA